MFLVTTGPSHSLRALPFATIEPIILALCILQRIMLEGKSIVVVLDQTDLCVTTHYTMRASTYPGQSHYRITKLGTLMCFGQWSPTNHEVVSETSYGSLFHCFCGMCGSICLSSPIVRPLFRGSWCCRQEQSVILHYLRQKASTMDPYDDADETRLLSRHSEHSHGRKDTLYVSAPPLPPKGRMHRGYLPSEQVCLQRSCPSISSFSRSFGARGRGETCKWGRGLTTNAVLPCIHGYCFCSTLCGGPCASYVEQLATEIDSHQKRILEYKQLLEQQQEVCLMRHGRL